MCSLHSKMAALTQRDDAWSWWHDLGNPQKVLAPMVGASERAFRMLCRRHGCDLAVTPMIHARLFGECDKLRRDVLRDLEGVCRGGRPAAIGATVRRRQRRFTEVCQRMPALRRWH